MQDIVIATRIFGNPDPLNGTEYEVRDRMVRKPCGSFYLIEGPDKPGGPEVVTPYSLQAVYDWLQDLPWQIERTVVCGAYRLYRASLISEEAWRTLVGIFLASWRRSRDAKRERSKDQPGPSYYVVRRHRLGSALIETVQRGLESGSLTPTKAGNILGVKPRSVAPLLYPAPNGKAA